MISLISLIIIKIRNYIPRDIGWIINRHSELYNEEYGWDKSYETLVSKILSDFIKHHNHKNERIWIAEQDGKRIGLVMIVNAGKQVAQLRLLLVVPNARNMGVGKRLINECIDFSKKNGYKKIILWTQSILTAAHHLYVKAGFKLVKREPHRSFGHDLIGETWELLLKND